MSVDGTAQGNRRIDRVLAEDFLDGLRDLPLAEVRQLRTEAEQEEVDLSYLRRMIQGRLDILRAERERRRRGGRHVEPTDLGPILGGSSR